MEIVAYASVSTLCVVLVFTLVKVRRILVTTEENIRTISSRAVPILDKLDIVSDRALIVVEKMDGHMDSLKGSIASVRQMTDSVVAFERRVQERLEGPIMDTADTLAALFKGVQTVLERLPLPGWLRS